MKIAKCVLLAVASSAFLGCDTSTPPLSDKDKKNFNGGPMPADTWKKMAESQAEWRKKHPEGSGSENPFKKASDVKGS